MALTNEDKIIFLANIISIARADGNFFPQETEAIEIIQKDINARKTELNKAYNLVESPDYEITPVGNWSDRIKNLEGMIYVAMVDGILDAKEKTPISNFAKKITINQEQINLIVKDIKNEITSLSNEAICPECKKGIKGIAKFCPECGFSLNQEVTENPASISYDIPKSGIAIEFAESTAAGFAYAVQKQQTAPVKANCLKAKKTWYLAAWPKEEIQETMKLVEDLKGMRNRKVYVDGIESRWDDVFGFAWCAAERDSAYRPLEYCFGIEDKRLNIWGCKHARMEWTEWADWFGYGSFDAKGVLSKRITFNFDKKRIRHELETNLFRCKFCPYIRFDLIEAILKEFPDSVEPAGKGPWGYKKDYNELPGAIKVIEKTTEGGYTYTEEYYSSGVSPRSVSTGIDILTKALETCGYKKAEVQGLLKFTG